MFSVRMYNLNTQTNKEAIEEPYYKNVAMEDEPGGHEQCAGADIPRSAVLFCKSLNPQRGVIDKNIRYRL